MEYTYTDHEPAAPQFVLRYTLTKEDFFENFYVINKKTKSGRKVIRSHRVALFVVCFFLACIPLCGLILGDPLTSGHILLLVFLSAFFLYYFIQAPKTDAKKRSRAMQRLGKKNPNSFFGPFELHIEDKQLVLRDELAGALYLHTTLGAIHQSKVGIILCYESINQMVTIPNRAFQNEALRKAFLSELSARSGVPIT